MADKTLLVTGAGGFLGQEITRLAGEYGWRVRAFDRSPERLPDGIEKIKGDIGDAAALSAACIEADALIHAAGLAHVFGAAAEDQEHFRVVNEEGTRRVFSAAAQCGVRRMVHVSSVSVYGEYVGDICSEANPCRPRGAYAVSKWQAELRAQEAINPQESSLTILRFATMYGEADRGNVGRLIRVVHRGRFLWPGHGTNRKSLIFREDAARACLLALEYERLGVEIYNVSALPVSLREIVTAICDALHMPIPKLGMPQAWLNVALWLAEKLGSQGTLSKTLHKITHDDCYDSSWFNRDYGFCPRISLAEGMKRAVAQLRD